jgi:amino acid transporter
MIGAGIFLFPGLAGGKAGMAAILSFALGAVVAFLVALPASELATAMPRSGGGYQFVSRGLGPLAGTAIGIGQWVGLLFASAFYLTGFGQYLLEFLGELGVAIPIPGRWIAFAAALALTGIAVFDTAKAGNLQNATVGLLLVLLGGFLIFGISQVAIVDGGPAVPDRFAPRGFGAVFPTAALVFTFYLGFIQITTVAGDIRSPAKNLPRALLGSIALVAVLYFLTMFLTAAVLPPDRLQELGGTALTEVARSLLGRVGALVVFGAGLLATISSANASILGSSRSIFALGRDTVFPRGVGRIHEKFGTPYRAVLLAGGPVAVLSIVGRLELLAQVASILHLAMYGLICLSVLSFRRRSPDEYRPSFRAPGYPWVPLLGAVASFGLLGWMDWTALVLAGSVFVLALTWHVVYVVDRGDRGVED